MSIEICIQEIGSTRHRGVEYNRFILWSYQKRQESWRTSVLAQSSLLSFRDYALESKQPLNAAYTEAKVQFAWWLHRHIDIHISSVAKQPCIWGLPQLWSAFLSHFSLLPILALLQLQLLIVTSTMTAVCLRALLLTIWLTSCERTPDG